MAMSSSRGIRDYGKPHERRVPRKARGRARINRFVALGCHRMFTINVFCAVRPAHYTTFVLYSESGGATGAGVSLSDSTGAAFLVFQKNHIMPAAK